jgi:DNA-binding transcriptional ArsR family regulator
MSGTRSSAAVNGFEQPAAIAQALADPLRLVLIDRLLSGPASVAELASVAHASQPKVSNHLAILRERRLVRSRRRGRQTVYELAGGTVADLVELLLSTEERERQQVPASDPLLLARTCYDHLAGKLGVQIFDALAQRGAVVPPEGSSNTVALGSNGRALLKGLGVDVEGAERARRRFALACLDWTERRAHLGGALGAGICRRFLDDGLAERDQGGRTLRVTDAGRRWLKDRLGIVFE